MKIYDPIAEDGLIDETNALCNTTNESYKNRSKISRFNQALDAYWFLAAQSAPQGTLDDTSKASAPIETQNLVDGTNQYKITDFTNKVLQILRVSILNEDGDEEDLIYEDFEDVNEFLERYSTETDDKGQPQYWTKIGDFIYISDTPDYNKTDGLRCYVSRELSKFPYVTFTTTFASDLFNATAHGLSAGDGLLFVNNAGALPAVIEGEKTIYYVIASGLTVDAFKVSTISGGSTITLADDGTGNHKFIKVSGEPGIPLIHHPYLFRFAAEKFMKTDHPNFAKTREDLLVDERDIQDYWQTMIKPGKTIIETKKRAYK